MALKLLNPGLNPLGQFDCLDGDIASIKGGEVLQFGSVAAGGSDQGTQDGYVNVGGTISRTVVQLAGSDSAPFMLADEGVAGYGTLFGTVVGATVGRSTSGAVLGPHTATGSGKVTAWDKPGLYAVSLDAVDGDKLVPSAPLTVGQELFFVTTGAKKGQLTTSTGTDASTVSVGNLVGFETNGSLVNTPNNLLAALNYGPGAVTGGANGTFAYLTFHFNPEGR